MIMGTGPPGSALRLEQSRCKTSMNERILVIEDEDGIARILQLELEHEGYFVGRASEGRSGLEQAMNGEWDLLLLDVMLPGLNGIEVLRRIRQAGNPIPIILITARDTIPDKVSGFEHGANDYITKPFAMEELLARVRNLLRIFQQQPKEPESPDVLKAADLSIELRTRKVFRKDLPIELTPREFELLVYLAEHGTRRSPARISYPRCGATILSAKRISSTSISGT